MFWSLESLQNLSARVIQLFLNNNNKSSFFYQKAN